VLLQNKRLKSEVKKLTRLVASMITDVRAAAEYEAIDSTPVSTVSGRSKVNPSSGGSFTTPSNKTPSAAMTNLSNFSVATESLPSSSAMKNVSVSKKERLMGFDESNTPEQSVAVATSLFLTSSPLVVGEEALGVSGCCRR